MDHTQALMELGLTEKEAQVYVALLAAGKSTATQISNKTKLHRPSIYDLLERLTAKGLAAHIVDGETKYFEACDPVHLSNLVKEKEAVLKQALPQLNLMKQLSGSKGEVKVVEGVTAFKNIMLEWLDAEEPIYVFGLPITAIQKIGLSFIEEFHTQRIAKKIWMYHIYNTTGKDRGRYLNNLPYTESKFLAPQFDSPVATNIIGDLLIMTHWEGPIVSLYIKNKQMAEAYRKYFSLLWEVATKEF